MGSLAAPVPAGTTQAAVGMYAEGAIAKDKSVKIAGRIPGSPADLVFTSTLNTVASLALRTKKPGYRWRTQS
jgi:hypothetical protein